MRYVTPYKDPDSDEYTRILCSCHDLDHYIEISRDEDRVVGKKFVDYTIGVQHNQHNLWIRIKMAVKLVLGKRIYSDVCLHSHQIKNLVGILQCWLDKDVEEGVCEN